MMTFRQKETLSFVTDYVRRTGVAPTFEEMMEALGLRSKSGVHRLLTALEERGLIRRLPSRARAIEVIRQPVSQAHTQDTALDMIPMALSVIDAAFPDNPSITEAVRIIRREWLSTVDAKEQDDSE